MASNLAYTPKKEDLTIFSQPESLSGALAPIQAWQDPEFRSESMEQKDILDFGDEGFLLENLMTESECQHYIKSGEEIGFQEIPEVKALYRNSTRILLKSKELANSIWERIKPYVKEVEIDGDPHDIHIHGVKTILQGKWRPVGVNDLFRLCKYEPGGHFAPHFDGHYVQQGDDEANVRSLKTFMMYLNGGFSGGTTNFVDESQTLHQDENGKYCAEEKNILYRITPQTGLAILFNHHRLHEGETVKGGPKYILRSDIMFEKYSGSTSPREMQALKLAQEAERLEALGQYDKAAEMYRKAFKLSPSVEAAY